MDNQASRPRGPVDDVLFLPELLEKILDYCSHFDQKQLLNCRLVCSFWRDCAFSVFANNLSILPKLKLNNPKVLDWSFEPKLLKFCVMVKPPSSLPVNAFMKYSSCHPLPSTFLQDYSSNMLAIVAYDLVIDSALEVTQFPQLRKLVVESFMFEDVPVRNLRNYLQTNGHRLVEVVLNISYNVQLGEMPNLKALKLGPEASVSGALPKWLPNLKHVSFGHPGMLMLEPTAVQRMTTTAAKFLSVIYLEIHDNWIITNAESKLMVLRLVHCFPNTKKLNWSSEMPSSQLIPAIQTVFTSLECLTSLRLVFEDSTAEKLFQLITNLSVEEIPGEEEHWKDALIDTSKTLCNLKLLKSLILENGSHYAYDYPSVQLTELESRFLLKAVFMRMENLRKIAFGHITYD